MGPVSINLRGVLRGETLSFTGSSTVAGSGSMFNVVTAQIPTGLWVLYGSAKTSNSGSSSGPSNLYLSLNTTSASRSTVTGETSSYNFSLSTTDDNYISGPTKVVQGPTTVYLCGSIAYSSAGSLGLGGKILAIRISP